MTFADIAGYRAAAALDYFPDRGASLRYHDGYGIDGRVFILYNSGKTARNQFFNLNETAADGVDVYSFLIEQRVKNKTAQCADTAVALRNHKTVNLRSRRRKNNPVAHAKPGCVCVLEDLYRRFHVVRFYQRKIVYDRTRVFNGIIGHIEGVFFNLVIQKFQGSLHTYL